MAPEQVLGRSAGAPADVFGFGAVLYEMLTGHRAFQQRSTIETMNAILNAQPAPIPGHLPPEITRIVRRCLHKDPARRYQTAVDLAAELKSAARHLSISL